MEKESLIAERQAIIGQHGPWGSHNVALPYGLFTMDDQPKGDNHRACKFLQLAVDLLRRPLHEVRVLDLGCGEGLYAIEFAQHGAHVLGVEGRTANFVKADFARRALALTTLEFVQEDVREVTRERHGAFDLILCSGILYHLDQTAVFRFLHALRRMCTGLCIIDTRISLTREVAAEFAGRRYWGKTYREHAPGASVSEKLEQRGASLDNEESFWFTRQSLANLLADLGYTSVNECWMPVPLTLRDDRATFVAVPGPEVRAFNEIGRALRDRRWPEAG